MPHELAMHNSRRFAHPVLPEVRNNVDHYGGVKGMIEEADVRAGKVAVIAPDRFLEEVTQEQVLVGGPWYATACPRP